MIGHLSLLLDASSCCYKLHGDDIWSYGAFVVHGERQC